MIGGYPRFDALSSPVEPFYTELAAKHETAIKRLTGNSRFSLLLAICKSNSWAGWTHFHSPSTSSALDRLPLSALSVPLLFCPIQNQKI